MKININYKPHKVGIKVRRITWKQRAEEQIAMINEKIAEINRDLREAIYG